MPPKVGENDHAEILLDPLMQTDKQVNPLDIVLVDKEEKRAVAAHLAGPNNSNLRKKEQEKSQ